MAGMADVIYKLAERTSEGGVPWKTAVGETSFSARLGNLLVLISSDSSRNTRLSVRNEKGAEVDSVESDNLPPRLSGTLDGLYNSARRTALGTEQTLAELLEFLDNAPPVSPEKPMQDQSGRRP